jgi:heterodisulfide reductase subunit A
MALKRFVADWMREQVNSEEGSAVTPVAQPDQTGMRVAIIGSGPAGLTCALDLARRGHAVTVYEALPVAGGMLRVGIPEYRLPSALVQREIDEILAEGVELVLNHRVEDIPALLEEGFQAVFVAAGAHQGIRLPIPGADLPEVTVATDFLREVSLGIHAMAGDRPWPRTSRQTAEGSAHTQQSSIGNQKSTIRGLPLVVGGRVLVLGGGNVAIDAAMSAVRLGARWVGMACLESRQKMPSHDWEVRDAEAEGIVVFPSRTFKEIVQVDGHVAGVRCVEVDFRGFVDGRPDFDEIPGTEEVILADVVIFAIGQRPEIGPLHGQVDTVRGRFPRVDPETLATSLPGVFAGGDVVTGTTHVVDAIAAGRQAARSIDDYLYGMGRGASLTPIASDQGTGGSPISGAFHQPDGTSSASQIMPAGETRPDMPPISGTGGSLTSGTPPRPEMPPSALPNMPSGETRPPVALSHDEIRRRIQATPSTRAARHDPQPRPAAERRKDFDEAYTGLTEEQARAEAARCLSCGICSECLQCVYACRAGAIDHNQAEEILELQVGAVILAPGLEPLPGSIRPEYGYGRYPNVVTSLEFERMLSASGPFGGVVQRPSDGAHPQKIAWIQCVGSRDSSCGQGYCSSVCCMYATKEAVIAREHDPRIQPSIFYMDIRAFGKGFDAYIERAEKEQGLRYVRSMVSAVKENPTNHNLRVSHATFEPAFKPGPVGQFRLNEVEHKLPVPNSENGQAGSLTYKPVPHEEEFDLVVLSIGLRPNAATKEMAQRLGIQLNEWGFAQSALYHPAESSRPGIYIAGAFGEPKDIPETVIEASCAASHASALLAKARGSLTRQASYPPERDIREEPPRVGVFVCHCGINIGGVVNVPEVVEWAAQLPGVVYAERNLYTCSQDTQEKIKAKVNEHGLNRVVVASCTPRTHEPLFQDTIRQAGLNPHLFELANLREQDAWVHRSDPATATRKAKGLVAMAVAKATRLRPLQRGTLDVQHSALVIGGGLAGMTAALSIAAQGFPVTLVEHAAQLGGHLHHIHIGFDGSHPQQLLQQTIARVSGDPRITVLLESRVVEVNGYVGNFQVHITQNGARSTPNTAPRTFDVGAIIVATGAQEITPCAYGYGQLPGVITQRELEELLGTEFSGTQAPGRPSAWVPDSCIMIQCVGSRDSDRPYCSRICCSQAIKNALEIKRRRPEAAVYILYRDLRSYGFRERLYREARQAGVIFLQYDPQQPPEVRQIGGSLQVQLISQPDRAPVTLPAGLVVLSAGIEAGPGNAALSRILKLPLTAEGFFLEAHVKLRPVDFAADGIYLCGLAHSPRSMDETIAQAQAAAVRAVALLAKKQLTATPIIASVNPRLCSACGLCVEVCPFGARRLEPGMTHAEVVDVLCQGCGACVAACPNKASQQRGFEFLQITSMLDAALDY